MLRTLILLAAGAAAFAAPAAQRDDRNAARVDRMLAGLVAGPPRTCITPDRSGSSTRYGDTLLIKDRGGILHVSQFDPGCAPKHDGDAMITRSPSGQACRGDIVEFKDLTSGAFGGSCAYGDFVPYRKAR